MFDQPNPRLAGRQTLSRIKRLQGDDKYIQVASADGVAGDPIIMFIPPSPLWMNSTGADLQNHRLELPAEGLLAQYLQSKVESDADYIVTYQMRGYFSQAGLSLSFYIDNEYVITVESVVGPTAWFITVDAVVSGGDPNADIYATAQARNYLSQENYIGVNGTRLALNYHAEKIIELYGSDPAGTGTAFCTAIWSYLQPQLPVI